MVQPLDMRHRFVMAGENTGDNSGAVALKLLEFALKVVKVRHEGNLFLYLVPF